MTENENTDDPECWTGKQVSFGCALWCGGEIHEPLMDWLGDSRSVQMHTWNITTTKFQIKLADERKPQLESEGHLGKWTSDLFSKRVTTKWKDLTSNLFPFPTFTQFKRFICVFHVFRSQFNLDWRGFLSKRFSQTFCDYDESNYRKVGD